MIALLILFACLSVALSGSSGVIVDGHALYYDRNVMQRVYAIRVRQGLAPAGWYGGLAAVPRCSHIGEVVRASFLNPHTHVWTPYKRMLVVDCAESRDLAMQLRTGRAIEADWGTAQWAGYTDTGRTRARVIYGGNE